MIFLGVLDRLTENQYKVGFIHYMPFHEKHGLGKTREQLEQEGILVESIPYPQQIEGKEAILHCNPTTKELWYEYEDIPKSEEDLQQEKIQALEQSIAELSATIAILQTPTE